MNFVFSSFIERRFVAASVYIFVFETFLAVMIVMKFTAVVFEVLILMMFTPHRILFIKMLTEI
jgi:hypothetical protein